MLRVRAGRSTGAARLARRQVLTRRSRRRGLWDVGARGAIVCRTAVAFRGRGHVLAVWIHFHVIGLWDEAALGAARALDGAGVCVRSCNRVCRGEFSTDTSMRSVTRTSYGGSHERAAMRAAVPGALARCREATHRSCFRAVVDDVAEPRTTHALPALVQRNPSGSAPTLRRCSLDGRRALAGQPPPTSLPRAIFATTPGENHAPRHLSPGLSMRRASSTTRSPCARARRFV